MASPPQPPYLPVAAAASLQPPTPRLRVTAPPLAGSGHCPLAPDSPTALLAPTRFRRSPLPQLTDLAAPPGGLPRRQWPRPALGRSAPRARARVPVDPPRPAGLMPLPAGPCCPDL
nr:vegetative cell wall protein gp1-like [Aegilops tauschii subsp. strangulata]